MEHRAAHHIVREPGSPLMMHGWETAEVLGEHREAALGIGALYETRRDQGLFGIRRRVRQSARITMARRLRDCSASLNHRHYVRSAKGTRTRTESMSAMIRRGHLIPSVFGIYPQSLRRATEDNRSTSTMG